MGGKIVIVKKDQHANLDSFPFRYGFSETDDFNLLIQYDSKPFVQNRGSQQRLRVNDAKFTNPLTGKAEKGSFVLVRNADDDHYCVITVIRKDENVDKSLSKALKIFRKYKYVSVKDLIDYFHPLYINGKIKTHYDLKKYLIKLNSDDKEKVKEIELVLKDAYKEIDKLELDKRILQTKIYDDYRSSDTYSRDEAIGNGWGDIYDEASKVAEAAFENYLEEHDDQIQERIEAKGKTPIFLSYTEIEKSMRKDFSEKSEDEIQRILRGWKAYESFLKKSILMQRKAEKEGKNQVVELTESERDDLQYLIDNLGGFPEMDPFKLYRDKEE